MVFKMIIAGIGLFSLGLVIGILIIYFFVGREFFSFMKIERKNFCSEMESNTSEIHNDIYDRLSATKVQNLLDDKEEFLDGNEE